MNKKLIFLLCLIYNEKERYVINVSNLKKTILLVLILEKAKEKNKLMNINDDKVLEDVIQRAERYLFDHLKNNIKKEYQNIFEIIKEDSEDDITSNCTYELVEKNVKENKNLDLVMDHNFEAVISKETEVDNEYLVEENSTLQSNEITEPLEEVLNKESKSYNYFKDKSNKSKTKISKTDMQIIRSLVNARNNRCKKYFKKINTTIRQLRRGQATTKGTQLVPEFQAKNIQPLNDIMVKIPVKIASIDINEMFYGDVVFEKPIISILSVHNEVFITEKNIVPSLNKNILKGDLFYEGYLRCQIEYLEDTSICNNHVYGESKYFIAFLPFEGTKEIELNCSLFNTSEWLVNDFIFDINKYDFNVKTTLKGSIKINKYLMLYNECNIILDFHCEGIIAQKKLVKF